MAAVLLTVAYDGSLYSGWAPQANARTIAGELLGALRAVDPGVREVRGTSRTDAGVHARCQIAAFDPTREITPRGWALALAAELPAEIAIRSVGTVADGFDPRRHAVRKRYRYLVLRDESRDPFHERRAWRTFHPLDLDLARAEAEALVGTHDFMAFRSVRDQRVDTVRTIESATWTTLQDTPQVLAFDIVGTAFLYNMVRIIAGTLVDVARGRLAPGAVARALASHERRDLGTTAPAHGLYLERIDLDVVPDDVWPL